MRNPLPNLDYPSFPPGWRVAAKPRFHRIVAIGPRHSQVVWSKYVYPDRRDEVPRDEWDALWADLSRRAWANYNRNARS
jgi:hypothetical protein